MTYILLLIGFILLVKGADYFVEGSSNLAKYLKVPSLIIGLTIVSLGTSMPEVIVSTISSLRNANDMAVSNVLGSNMFNLLIVLGLTAAIKPLTTKTEVLTRDYIVMIITSIILLLFMSDKILNYSNFNVISRGESLVLLLCFTLYLYIILLKARKNKYKTYEVHKLSAVDILMLLSGFFAIILGGELVVRMAKMITINLGITETIVGLTLVSVGTSIPELVTSIVAAIKGKTDIAIGNAIGSNIYNTLLVVGISGSLSEIYVKSTAIIDTLVLISVSIISYILILKNKKISRTVGILLVLIYILFIIFIVNR